MARLGMGVGRDGSTPRHGALAARRYDNTRGYSIVSRALLNAPPLPLAPAPTNPCPLTPPHQAHNLMKLIGYLTKPHGGTK